MTRSALQGLTVVELGDGLSAPFAGKLLADMGARVVKIEPPGRGDVARTYGPFPDDRADPERSGMFHYLNAGKESVALDVGSPPGRAVLERLCEGADALIVNGDVAELEAARLTHADLSAQAPRLVVATITPFGFDCTLRHARAHDVTICALGGVTGAVGEKERAPLTPPLQLSAYQAGLAAASATLLAIFARRSTGRGQHVDISPLDVWATVHQGSAFANYVHFGRVSWRAGRRRREAYPFHFLEASDGLMCLIARDGRQWKRFIEAVGNPELLNNPRYADRWVMGTSYPAEVDAILQPWFSARTRQEIFAVCREHHVPFAPVRRIDEVVECEQLAGRGFFIDLPEADGGFAFRVPGSPYRMGATPAAPRGPAPTLGRDTRRVLAGLGYDAAAIDALAGGTGAC